MAMASGTPGRVLPVGTRLGKYTLERLLARGGMAELYLARARGAQGFEKLVALKLVLPHLADDPKFLGMFLDEARLAGRLDHPNIAQVLDLGTAGGEHFMAMEFVHGVDVRSILANAEGHVAIPLDAALTIVVEACRGLHYAHELTDETGQPLWIVHRDVSPSNLLVRYDGVVKLVDFGIAKAADRYHETATGMLKGKSGYMSPEQCRGLQIDRRTDVFGLGILLYELTTAQRLFYGDNEFAILNRIVDGEFERPSEVVPGYPVELENIVLQALDPRVDNRFATAQELQDALETFARRSDLVLSSARLAGLMRGLFGDPPPPSVSRVVPVAGSLTSSIRRRRSRFAALGLGLAGSCLAVAGYLVGTASSSGPPVSEGAPSAEEPTPERVRVTDPPVRAVEEVARDIAEVQPDAAGDDSDAPQEAEPDPAGDPGARAAEGEDERTSSSSRKGKRRRAKQGARRHEPSTRKPGPGRTPNSMMPRE
jgi:serine/threonine protein kinase